MKMGESKTLLMGCYGIGISRTMATVIEQHHDENGLIWPVSIAPYHVIVLPVSVKDQAQMEIAEQIYRDLIKEGFRVLLMIEMKEQGLNLRMLI